MAEKTLEDYKNDLLASVKKSFDLATEINDNCTNFSSDEKLILNQIRFVLNEAGNGAIILKDPQAKVISKVYS